MLTIALTGGIGSGKTKASDYFKHLGIEIIDADIIARELVQAQSPTLEKIQQHFGNDILLENGNLNRKKLRDIIVNSKSEKNFLDDLMHPLIVKEIYQQIIKASSPYVIVSIALLIETKLQDKFDRVLLITADLNTKITRICKRDNVNIEQAKKIIQLQTSDDILKQYADDIVTNNSDISALHVKLDLLHKKYQLLAKESNYKK